MALDAFEAASQLARSFTDPGVIDLLTEVGRIVDRHPAGRQAFALAATLAATLQHAPDDVLSAGAAVIMLTNQPAATDALRLFGEACGLVDRTK